MEEVGMGSTSSRARDGFDARATMLSVPAIETGIAPMPVFWVYADYEGRWCLRKEGGAIEAEFPSRRAAIIRLRELIEHAPSYRAFIAKADGRMIQEMRNLGRMPQGRPLAGSIG
jgi:hypothetical protein